MRTAAVKRKTGETDISLELSLDKGEISVDTGIGFFDHMLVSFATHGGFGLKVKVQGDLNVDGHHTVEDTGIVLGKAFCEALGDKCGIARFAHCFIPMDESLSFCAVDISGRPFLSFDASFAQEKTGDYDFCLTEEFFRAFAVNSSITLHMKNYYGTNAHHQCESLFKAAAHALRKAVAQTDGEILSTKGVL